VATSAFLRTPQWVQSVRPDQLPVGSVGFDSYYFRGIPVVKDDKCPTGLIYTLNENYLKYVSLPLVGSAADFYGSTGLPWRLL
jgi:hypothetical protein